MNTKNKSIVIYLSLALLIAVIFIPKLFLSGSSGPSLSPAMGGNEQISVKAHIADYESISSRVYSTGTILANEEVELRSEVSGKITKILFKEGSYIAEGQLLVKINDADLQAQLRKADSKVRLSKDKEFRQRQLREGNLISQEEYDNTLSELNINIADYELIKAQIDKTEIRAPFSGVVGLRSVSTGSFVTTSSVIARLQNLSTLKIDFSIPERYSFVIGPGDELEFKVSGSSNLYKAKIYAIEPRIDPATRTIKIRAICSDYRKELVAGAFANVELRLKEIRNAILIPTVAIVPEMKGQIVYLSRNGTVVPRNVEIGIREETRVQITTGLNAGDTVITSGVLLIKPGSKIKISEYN